VSVVRFIAFRYLFAKKRTNFINIVTGISFGGVLVGAAALIVVLSVYNGLEELTQGMYSKFNPDVRVRPLNSKLFSRAAMQAQLEQFPQINGISYSIEENALFRYGDRELVGVIKGVDSAFVELTRVNETMVRGEYVLRDGFGLPYAMLGVGIGYQLQISLNDYRRGIEVYVPARGKKIDLLRPETSFVKRSLQPAGIFDVQPEINQQYVLVPLVFVSDLLGVDEDQVGEAAMQLKPGINATTFSKSLQTVLGSDFEVKDRYRQQEAIFKIFQTEKWWTYFFLLLIVLVAALNLVGALSMLVIEKQRDIAILGSLGASKPMLFGIFMAVGSLITLVGASLGIGLGALLCWLQQQYEFIRFAGEGAFVVSAYPVSLRFSDAVVVFAGVLAIGALCTLYPALKAARSMSIESLRA
jgi:lipoprotein-releasing system permease protein